MQTENWVEVFFAYNSFMHSVSKIKQLLASYHTTPSKRFGQNFLIDQNITKKIVESADVQDKDVLEIGPGLGSLTLALLETAKSVVSYEVDRDMIAILQQEITNPKFTLIEGDFLKQSLDWQGKKIIVANIPYNITTNILFKLLENSHLFTSAIIMVQKEFADRLLAKANTGNYSKLTVSVAVFGKVSKVIDVPASCFLPSPKVDSTVFRIDFNNHSYKQEQFFLNFMKRCFAQKRKTLVNNLKSYYEKAEIEQALRQINKEMGVRPQELSFEDFRQLFLLVD